MLHGPWPLNVWRYLPHCRAKKALFTLGFQFPKWIAVGQSGHPFLSTVHMQMCPQMPGQGNPALWLAISLQTWIQPLSTDVNEAAASLSRSLPTFLCCFRFKMRRTAHPLHYGLSSVGFPEPSSEHMWTTTSRTSGLWCLFGGFFFLYLHSVSKIQNYKRCPSWYRLQRRPPALVLTFYVNRLKREAKESPRGFPCCLLSWLDLLSCLNTTKQRQRRYWETHDRVESPLKPILKYQAAGEKLAEF